MTTRNFYHFHIDLTSKWINYYNGGDAALNHFVDIDVTMCTSQEELNIKVGYDKNTKAAKPKELWRFKNANIGDIIFANETKDKCIGIGIIESDYYYNSNRKDLKHSRKVKWITKKEFTYFAQRYSEHFKGDEPYKELFYGEPFDTVIVKRGDFILNEYIVKYPELKEVFIKNNILL